MSPMPLTCERCGVSLTPGEALRITTLDTGRSFALHRPTVVTYCLLGAGPAEGAAIALWDAEAAREYDRIVGGSDTDTVAAASSRAAALRGAAAFGELHHG
jgi:hypothetical protein